MNICFDTDECLVDGGKPIPANVELLKLLSKTHKVFIWSGNGFVHAFDVAKKLYLLVPEIAFDNQEIDLGKVNIKL